MGVFAFFEVMDKEPSLLVVWITSLLLGIGGLLLSKYKWWLVTIVILIALTLALAQMLELRDPSVGSTIARESGYTYVVQSYVAALISILLPSIGLMMNWKRRE